MGGIDKIQNLLDEHMVVSQAMQFSAFKKPFEERLEKWNNIMQNISNVIEEWSKL